MLYVIHRPSGHVLHTYGGDISAYVCVPQDDSSLILVAEPGHMRDWYQESTDTFELREPVEFSLSPSIGVVGESVIAVGLPADAWVLVGDSITQDREWTLSSRQFRVHLVGKYSGEAICDSHSLDALRELALDAAVRKYVSGLKIGKEIQAAASVDDLRKLLNRPG